MNKKKLTYISAISDQKSEAVLGDDYISGQIKSGRMLKITHKGSYKFLGNAWSMGMMTMRAQKLKKAGDPFEYYHNNPLTTAEEDLLTDVYFPVK